MKVPRIIIYINKKNPQKATKNKTKNSKNKKKRQNFNGKLSSN